MTMTVAKAATRPGFEVVMRERYHRKKGVGVRNGWRMANNTE
jgi:hypothetical protein